MRFAVKGLDKMHGVVHLELDAPSEVLARCAVEQQGVAVLALRRRRSLARDWLPKRLNLVGFSQELSALLEAGLTLVEAIETQLEKETRPLVRVILGSLLDDLRRGQPLSQAMQQQPRVFSPLFVATIRASERTGDLPEALTRFIAYQSQLNKLRNQLVSASIYPVLLLLVASLVGLFLMLYVVPKFSHIYDERQQSLPFLSSLLMRWGHMVENHVGSIVGTLFLMLTLTTHAFSRAELRAKLLSACARLPLIAEQIRVYYLARFYRTVAMLLNSGIPILPALGMAEGLLAYPWLKQRLRAATQRVNEGWALSRALQEHALTTPVAVRMLRVGERSGEMGNMMERVASFMDQDLARAVDLFARLFEPLLMALIGVVIGAIVILMYFPIFELVGSVQ